MTPPLTPESFVGLPLPEQLYAVLDHGTLLTTRYEETYAVTHYLVNGFFADLYYAAHALLPERIHVLDDRLW
ncbi:hypothetical protein GCM10027048_30610 [Hymenobacter coalescens]